MLPRRRKFTATDVKLTREQMKAIEQAGGTRMRHDTHRVWKVMRSDQFIGWFIVDEVMGKHEFITWVLALNADGSVQAASKSWTIAKPTATKSARKNGARSFTARQHGAKLKLDDDIKNVSGATLSCRHITDGVKRLLRFYELVLK